MKNRGFTLIELLIVVLIVGVLVAVAVPQYEKAVMRSRLAETKVIMRSILPAVEEYCLAQGATYDPIDMSSLSISYPVKDLGGVSAVFASSGVSMTLIEGTCKSFLQNNETSAVIFSYLFNPKMSSSASLDQMEGALYAAVGINRSGTRICQPVNDADACSKLGFQMRKGTMSSSVCNSDYCGPITTEYEYWTD